MLLISTYSDVSHKYFFYSSKIYQMIPTELRLIYGASSQEYLCDLWDKVLNKQLLIKVKRE